MRIVILRGVDPAPRIALRGALSPKARRPHAVWLTFKTSMAIGASACAGLQLELDGSDNGSRCLGLFLRCASLLLLSHGQQRDLAVALADEWRRLPRRRRIVGSIALLQQAGRLLGSTRHPA